MQQYPEDLFTVPILGKLVVEEGLLTRRSVQRRRRTQIVHAMAGKRVHLGEILVENGEISDSALARLLDLQRTMGLFDLPAFEDFEIVERIGVGANAQVFRARQHKVSREIALKIHTEKENSIFLRRFLREAKAVAELNHPNIVQAIDSGEVDGTHYFAMELVNGPTLQDVLTVYSRLPERKSMEIAGQLASALQHIEAHQMVHRDLKPTNVIMEDNLAKLCDLGLARHIDTNPDSFTLTQQGVVVGTPHFLSPEQTRGDTDLDIRTDLYALGAVIYRMVTGQLLFDGDSLHALLQSQLHDEPLDARKLCPSLSTGTYTLINDLLKKDRKSRPSTSETVERIHECLSKLAPDTKPLLAKSGFTCPEEATAQMKPPAVLISIDGDRRRTIPLFGDEILLGRESSCHIVMRDPWISRRHFRIRRTSEHWILEDLHSHNGTRVNGVSIRRRVLAPGDVIQVKDTLLEFQIGDEI